MAGAVAQAQEKSGLPRVYGIEIDDAGPEERVLVFANGVVRPRLETVNPRSVVLVFPGAELDDTAPKRVRPSNAATIELVTAFGATTGDSPEVRIRVQRSPGKPPALSQRGSTVALTFQKPAGTDAQASRKKTQREPTLAGKMLEQDVKTAVTRLAEFTNRSLLLPDAMQGRVSIESPNPITRSQAEALLEATLLMKGYAAVPTPGGVDKVVPITGAVGPWSTDINTVDDVGVLTTLVELEEIDASFVLQAIRPMVGERGVVQALEGSNTLLLAGATPRLRRLIRLIGELDSRGPRKLVLLPLRYADASSTAEKIQLAFRDRIAPPQVIADERTNRVLVQGRPEVVAEVRGFVSQLDREESGEGSLRVVPLRFAEPDRIAETLRTLQAADASGARGDRTLAGRDFAVSVHAPTHSLVIRADPQTHAAIDALLREIDVVPARIDVEVSVAEFILSDDYRFSLSGLTPVIQADDVDDLAAFIVNDPEGTVLPSLLDPTSLTTSPLNFVPDGSVESVLTYEPIVLPILGPGGQPVTVAAVAGVSMDDSGVESRMLMQPRLSLLNGEEHEIFAGSNVPILVSASDTQGALEIRRDVERQDVGIDLRVQPTLGSGNVVSLDLLIEVSGVARVNPVAGGTGVILTERTIESRASLTPGRVAVIAWASTPTVQETRFGVPYLMDMPILGFLFRRTQKQERAGYLIVLARAEVYRPEAAALRGWIERELAADPQEAAVPLAPTSP